MTIKIFELRLTALATLLLAASFSAGALAEQSPAATGNGPLAGQVFGDQSGHYDSSHRVQTSVIPSWGGTTVAPGGDLIAAVVFDHEEKWHVHTHDPQVPTELGSADLYIATSIEAEAEAGGEAPLTVHTEAIQWPEPEEIEVAFLDEPVRYAVYAGRAVAYVPITVNQDAEPGTYPVTFSLTYQACDDKTCIAPVQGQSISVEVEVGTMEAAAASELASEESERLQEEFAGFDASVWPKLRSGQANQVVSVPFFGTYDLSSVRPGAYAAMMLGIAFLGGAILNLTPCVLPVIPLKVMALANAAGSRQRTLFLGIVMAVGLLGFWLVIGGMITGLKHFQAVNQLFQNAGFTIGVGVFIAVMGVGMLGVFPINLPRWVYSINPTQETVFGSLLYGVMAAVLATPCAGPFMGFAVAWATQVSPIMTLGIFGCVGLGMAMPYLILSAYPKLTHKIPRTG
ncbi:MAG: cytochrome c biogenesis protein CcdA, partial [Phycisphaeraceae bacterium]